MPGAALPKAAQATAGATCSDENADVTRPDNCNRIKSSSRDAPIQLQALRKCQLQSMWLLSDRVTLQQAQVQCQ